MLNMNLIYFNQNFILNIYIKYANYKINKIFYIYKLKFFYRIKQ